MLFKKRAEAEKKVIKAELTSDELKALELLNLTLKVAAAEDGDLEKKQEGLFKEAADRFLKLPDSIRKNFYRYTLLLDQKGLQYVMMHSAAFRSARSVDAALPALPEDKQKMLAGALQKLNDGYRKWQLSKMEAMQQLETIASGDKWLKKGDAFPDSDEDKKDTAYKKSEKLFGLAKQLGTSSKQHETEAKTDFDAAAKLFKQLPMQIQKNLNRYLSKDHADQLFKARSFSLELKQVGREEAAKDAKRLSRRQ